MSAATPSNGASAVIVTVFGRQRPATLTGLRTVVAADPDPLPVGVWATVSFSDTTSPKEVTFLVSPGSVVPA